jgi:ABC-type oligopeptide transport system substrate-binding subunit
LPGYPIALATMDQGALLTALSGHALQLWYITWIADYPDAQDWLTNQFLPGVAYNDGDVNLPDATRAMLAADVTRDPPTRLQRYAAAEQLLVTSVAWLPLDQPKLWWEAAPGVVGFRLDGRGMSTLAMWQHLYLAHR